MHITDYELLGGAARDRIRVYQWVGGDEPADVADHAHEKVEAGFTALKMNRTPAVERIDSPATVRAAADRMREVREAVGPEIDVGVDFHGADGQTTGRRTRTA